MIKGVCKYKDVCSQKDCPNECKVCKEYKRIANKKYHTSEKGRNKTKEYRKEYRTRDYVKEKKIKYARERYSKIKNTEQYKLYQKEISKKRRETKDVKILARSAVSHAIASGKLVKPNECSMCNKSNIRLEAHHFSYKKENWLNVIWLCTKCHKNIHKGDDNV